MKKLLLTGLMLSVFLTSCEKYEDAQVLSEIGDLKELTAQNANLLAEQQAQIDAINASIQNEIDRVNELVNAVASTNFNLDDLTAELEAAQNQLAQADADNLAQALSAVAIAEANLLVELEANISTVNAELTSLNMTDDQLISEIDNVLQTILNVEAALQAEDVNLADAISTLDGALTQANTLIDANTMSIASLQAQINAIVAEAEALQAQVNAIDFVDPTELADAIHTVVASATYYDSIVATNANAYTDDAVANLQSQVNVIDAAVSNLNNVQDGLNNLQSQIDGLNFVSPNALSTAINSVLNDSQAYADNVAIAALSDANAYTDNAVAGIQSQVNVINTAVSNLNNVQDDLNSLQSQIDGLNFVSPNALSTAINSVLEDSQEYADNIAVTALSDANAYADAADVAIATANGIVFQGISDDIRAIQSDVANLQLFDMTLTNVNDDIAGLTTNFMNLRNLYTTNSTLITLNTIELQNLLTRINGLSTQVGGNNALIAQNTNDIANLTTDFTQAALDLDTEFAAYDTILAASLANLMSLTTQVQSLTASVTNIDGDIDANFADVLAKLRIVQMNLDAAIADVDDLNDFISEASLTAVQVRQTGYTKYDIGTVDLHEWVYVVETNDTHEGNVTWDHGMTFGSDSELTDNGFIIRQRSAKGINPVVPITITVSHDGGNVIHTFNIDTSIISEDHDIGSNMGVGKWKIRRRGN